LPFYPMKCGFARCGAEFDYFTKPALYDRSKESGFRDVRCVRCGSFGSMGRIYPSDSAPANLTVKGTWGKHASPELKGRDFYTKQERDRQLTSIGRVAIKDDEGLSPKKNNAVTTYAHNGTEVVEQTSGVAEDRPSIFDEEAFNPPKRKTRRVVKAAPKKKAKKKKAKPSGPKPTELILAYAKSNGGAFTYDEILKSTDVAPKRILGGIISGIRTGWLMKGEVAKSYRLTDHA